MCCLPTASQVEWTAGRQLNSDPSIAAPSPVSSPMWTTSPASSLSPPAASKTSSRRSSAATTSAIGQKKAAIHAAERAASLRNARRRRLTPATSSADASDDEYEARPVHPKGSRAQKGKTRRPPRKLTPSEVATNEAVQAKAIALLVVHGLDVNSSFANKVACPVDRCAYHASGIAAMIRHGITHLPKSEREFPCTYPGCETVLTRSDAVTRHVNETQSRMTSSVFPPRCHLAPPRATSHHQPCSSLGTLGCRDSSRVCSGASTLASSCL